MPTLVACGLLAILCTLSAMDRSAAEGSAPSPLLMKSGFGIGANRRGVYDALNDKQPARAVGLAAAAVAADPVAPGSAALLGTVRLVQGLADPARAAFTVAAGFGWRDVATQLYWLRQAQALGDAEVMAQRADAVLRTAPLTHLLDDTIASLESDPVGRSALAKRLADQPGWAAIYIGRARLLRDEAAIANRAATVRQAVGDGMIRDCRSIAAASTALVAQQRVAEAATLWFSLCRSGSGPVGGLADGDFEQTPPAADASPFDWHLTSTGRIQSEIEAAPAPLHGKALGFRSTSSVREIVATRIILLAPASYRISWSATGAQGYPQGAFLVSIGCIGAGPHTLAGSPAPSSTGRYTIGFSVPQGCAAQRLTISGEPQRANGDAPAMLDDLSIDRLPGV